MQRLILGYLITLNIKLLYVCILTLAVIATLYKIQLNKEKKYLYLLIFNKKFLSKEKVILNKEILFFLFLK